jgi:type II secretory pathway pseudopilin PulG
MKSTRANSERGVTLIEATVVLTVSAVLTLAMAPIASRTVDNARLARAASDVKAIRTAIHSFITEFTAFTPFTVTGLSGGATVAMLVSDGDTPREVGAGGASDWIAAVDPLAVSPVDFLERHLVTNTPGDTGAYTTGGAGPWRGAYISAPVDPDPWGNRYAVNVQWLRTAPTSNDVFVLSAGPNERIDTLFAVNGATPGDDDLTAVVRRHPGLTVP